MRRKKHKNKRRSATMDKYISIIKEQLGDWVDEAPDVVILEGWASLWSVSATEQIENSAETMTVTHKMRLEYTNVIDKTMIIKYGTRKFNIVGIMSLYEEDKVTEITAEEIL